MRTKYLFVILVMLTNFSCKSKYIQQGFPKDCKDFYTFIKKNWIKSDKGDFYPVSKQFLIDIRGKHGACLRKLNVQQVLYLFGEPKYTYEDEWYKVRYGIRED